MSQRASRWMRGIVAALLAGSFGLLGNARPARAASDDFWLSYKELGRPMPYYYLELGRPLSLDGMPEQNKLLVDSTEYGWGLEWPVPYYSRLGKTITVRTRIVVDPLWETSLLKDIPLICVDEFQFVRTFG